ncbi:PilW family protein [Aeromonas veronii]
MLSVPSRQRGVSLVELMISMVLGLMLMLAIFAGYAPIKSTVEQSKALEQANEVLRFATLTFTNSIKQADQLIAVTPDRLTLAFKVEGAVRCSPVLATRKPPILPSSTASRRRYSVAMMEMARACCWPIFRILNSASRGRWSISASCPKGCPAIWHRE